MNRLNVALTDEQTSALNELNIDGDKLVDAVAFELDKLTKGVVDWEKVTHSLMSMYIKGAVQTKHKVIE